MEYQAFICRITDCIQTILGDRYQVQCHPVCKNNGIVLDGLIVMSDEANISPTVYLNPYYEQFSMGRPMDEIIWEIFNLFKQAPQFGLLDLDQLTDFETVRESIAIKLINYEANRDLLASIPHRKFLDLAIVYYFVLRNEILGNATVLIRNEHAQLWQTNEAALYRIGMKNTLSLGWEIRPMNTIIRDYLCEELNEYLKGRPEPVSVPPTPDHVQQLAEEILNEIYNKDDDGPLYVLSNHQRFFGASCILYKDKLNEFAQLKNSDLYILPSSIHEVIIIPKTMSPDYSSLCRMVKEINDTEVDACDRLSDCVYRFSLETGKLS